MTEVPTQATGSDDHRPRKGPVVFVSDFVYVHGESEVLAERLLAAGCEDGSGWLAPIAIEAASGAQGPKVKVGAGSVLAKAVRVELGVARRHGLCVLVPMTWEATGIARAFPRLEADLELAPLGVDECRLGLTGRYRIPLGVVGSVANAAGLHRLAEITMRRFLAQVAEALEASTPTSKRALPG